MTKFSKYNKLASIILLSTCTVFILSLFIYKWLYISFYFHEFIALIINIGIFLIPIEALEWFIIWRTYCNNKSDSIISNTILNLISVLSFLMCVSIFTYFLKFS